MYQFTTLQYAYLHIFIYGGIWVGDFSFVKIFKKVQKWLSPGLTTTQPYPVLEVPV